GYITLTSHNHTAHGINEAKMAALPGASCTYQAALEGTFPEYLYPTDASLTLKAGAQVMFIKNDPSPEKRYYNGKIGIVTGLDDGSVEVLPHGAAEPIAVEPAEWLNTKYKIDPETKELTEEVEGRFVQYPLKAAWAITIHKSQGLTFERAVIDAADSFSHGQVYVALSRCKSLEGLVLRAPLDARCMICDPTVRAFTDYAAEHRPDGALLARQAEAYYRRLLLELFDFAAVGNDCGYSAGSSTNTWARFIRNCRYVATAYGAFQHRDKRCRHSFQKQIDRMIGGAQATATICARRRVGKGRDYFLARCGEIIDPLLAACDVEIDSKELRKDFAKMLSAAGDQVRIKKAVLEATADGFDLHRYLEAKAKASLEESRSSVGAEAKVTVSDDVLHPALFETLRSWRKEEAGRQKVPVYVVMSQKALLGVSNLLPSSLRELARIKGVGDKFLEKYGDTVLEFVREFRAETGADMDFPTPEVAVRPDAGGTKPKRKEREDTRLVTLGLLEEGLPAAKSPPNAD
ncbi:MAG: HRDC domain-containing protein, partial [Alistipes sp.]